MRVMRGLEPLLYCSRKTDYDRFQAYLGNNSTGREVFICSIKTFMFFFPKKGFGRVLRLYSEAFPLKADHRGICSGNCSLHNKNIIKNSVLYINTFRGFFSLRKV